MSAAENISADRWVIIAADYTIVSAGTNVPGVLPTDIGASMWDLFPDARETFEPVYAAAFTNGQAASLVYWNDTIIELICHRRGDTVVVHFDYLTVGGLRATLGRVIQQVDLAQRTDRSLLGFRRRHLRAVR